MMRRYLSLLVAAAMMVPSFSAAAEAAVGTWLSPPAGEVITGDRVEVAVGFNTQSDMKVSELELWIDGKFYGKKYLRTPATRGVCSFWWYTGTAKKGEHDLVVKIMSKDDVVATVTGVGTVGRSSSNVTVPTVTFANIKSGDVLEGVIDVELNVSGAENSQALVSLLVDDLLKLLKNTPPYTYSLDTTTYADGDHELKTYAYDVSGNKSDPAVVNVTFNNGIERPVVTTLSVEPESRVSAQGEPEVAFVTPAEIIPVVPGVSSTGSRVGRTAAESNTHAVAPPSAPVATEVDRTHVNTHVASLPDPVISYPAPKSAVSAIHGEAVASDVQRQAVSTVPQIRTDEAVDAPTTSAPAEPGVTQDASSNSVTRVAMAPEFNLRVSKASPAHSSSAVAAAEMVWDEPVSSDTVRVVASSQPTGLRNAEIGEPAASVTAVSAAPPSNDAAIAAPERMQVALAPSVRGTQHSPCPAAVARPAPVEKPTKARLKKAVTAASGEVKARDMFEGLGGVLLWDNDTKTVTVYLNGSVMELKIGSSTARVNGQAVELARAPYIVDGRTVIDAGFYAQVCAIQQ